MLVRLTGITAIMMGIAGAVQVVAAIVGDVPPLQGFYAGSAAWFSFQVWLYEVLNDRKDRT